MGRCVTCRNETEQINGRTVCPTCETYRDQQRVRRALVTKIVEATARLSAANDVFGGINFRLDYLTQTGLSKFATLRYS
jgi:hypothetical protein